MKVLVAGSINIDLVAKIDRFPNEGETLMGKTLTQLIGGKGANQSTAVAKQGVQTTLWGMVGSDDFGACIKKEVVSLNISPSISVGCESTGVAIIETDSGGKNRIVVIPGANGEFTVDEAKKNISILDEHDILVMQFEIPMDTVEFLAQEAKKRNKLVIINPAPAMEMSDALLESVDYLIPNEHELSIISGMPVDNYEQVIQAVDKIKDKVSHMIVTLGGNGVFVSSKEYTGSLKAYDVKIVDTTGAGDSFIGCLAGALAKGLSLEEAVSYANKGAAISVTRMGAFNSSGSTEEITNFKI